jgi:hypothetical protein
MLKTIQLMEDKNAYLIKFMALNKAKLDKLAKNDFTELELFRDNRENILNIIKHIDGLIETRFKGIDVTMISTDTKKHIHKLLIEKDDYVRAILAQDLEIMQIIDHAKSQIITELQQVRKGRKTISSYKSYNKKETFNEEF